GIQAALYSGLAWSLLKLTASENSNCTIARHLTETKTRLPMKALPYILALLLLATGCDQPQGTQTDSEIVLQQNEQSLQSSQQVAPQASTAQQTPGNTDAGLVTSRKLLDNVTTTPELKTFAAL